MSVLFVVLPVAVLVATAFVVAFVWSVRGGQLDDLDTPALRVLHDEVEPELGPGESGVDLRYDEGGGKSERRGAKGRRS